MLLSFTYSYTHGVFDMRAADTVHRTYTQLIQPQHLHPARATATADWSAPRPPVPCPVLCDGREKRKPREGWEDGTPPTHRDLKNSFPKSFHSAFRFLSTMC